VEINALWNNALRNMEHYLKQTEDPAANEIAAAADRAAASFNRRFWCPAEKGLYDVVDGEQGDDASCRPNQIFAIALDFPVLDQSKWQPVFETVSERLMTPLGLRTLAPGHMDYKPKYSGDLRSRDAAYHQGTVWAWLIGPYIDAWFRVYPDRKAECRHFLTAFDAHLGEACVGTISEIFDAEAPFTPRGCVAQAWSVAEAIRALVKVGGVETESSE
jgi:glycogen debranching enzyme